MLRASSGESWNGSGRSSKSTQIEIMDKTNVLSHQEPKLGNWREETCKLRYVTYTVITHRVMSNVLHNMG